MYPKEKALLIWRCMLDNQLTTKDSAIDYLKRRGLIDKTDDILYDCPFCDAYITLNVNQNEPGDACKGCPWPATAPRDARLENLGWRCLDEDSPFNVWEHAVEFTPWSSDAEEITQEVIDLIETFPEGS